MSCLSRVWAEDRMAAASTCYANVTCLSAAAAHRHTQCGDPGSAYTQGVRPRPMLALRHRCIYLVIYLCLQFSALTHSTALTLDFGTCVCTLICVSIWANPACVSGQYTSQALFKCRCCIILCVFFLQFCSSNDSVEVVGYSREKLRRNIK